MHKLNVYNGVCTLKNNDLQVDLIILSELTSRNGHILCRHFWLECSFLLLPNAFNVIC